jgi:hypothetical protein
MNFKKIVSALALGLSASFASATPLDLLTGDLEIKLGGLTTEANVWAGTNETTWGVGYIESMTSFNNAGKWQSGTDDGYLYYMIYGIADISTVANNSFGFDIYNVGATGGAADGQIHLDIYRSPTKIDSIEQFKNASPALRTGFDSYSLFNGLGPAYLELTVGQGIQLADRPETPEDETQATLVQDVSAVTLPASGKGAFFADVVGGTAAGQWDTNGQDLGHDLSGNFTLRPNYGRFNNPNCTEAQALSGACFSGLINDPILTSKIPEPASLALFGLGLAGVAALRRRRT